MTTETLTCPACKASYDYEPILVFGRDLGRALFSSCPDCTEKEKRAEEERAAAEERERRLQLIRDTLPPEMLPRAMDPDGTDIYHPEFPLALWRQLQSWRPGARGNWLGIVGPAGRAKTRMLALLAEKIMSQGIRLVWTTATRLHTEAGNLRSHDRSCSTVAREHLAECLHSPWLIIDDIGKNEWSAAFETQFFQILDHRKNYRLPLAYSSNAHPQEFASCISNLNASPIIGRLLDRTNIVDLS